MPISRSSEISARLFRCFCEARPSLQLGCKDFKSKLCRSRAQARSRRLQCSWLGKVFVMPITRSLRMALLLPALAAWAAIVALSWTDPKHNPFFVPGMSVLLCTGLIELFVVPIALKRLIALPEGRTAWNLVAFLAGLSVIGTWLFIFFGNSVLNYIEKL
jgi:hypothetical protein